MAVTTSRSTTPETAWAPISPATVSRVLNGRPGVTDTTKAKVTAALATLGFEDLPSPRPARYPTAPQEAE